MRLQLHNLGQNLGLFIPANVFGPGLSIAHYGAIDVGKEAKVGANCRFINALQLALFLIREDYIHL
jgi:serine O-acetyltransferase